MLALKQTNVKRRAAEAGWALLAQGGRFVLQGLSFVVLARAIKADGMGIIGGAMGLVNVFAPFCGWGGANLAQKYISRNVSNYGEYLGNAFVLLAISGVLCTALAVALGPVLLGDSFRWALFLMLVASEMLVLRLADIAALLFAAVDRLDLTARVHLLGGLMRVAASLLCVFTTSHPSATGFAFWYLLTSLITGIVSLVMIRTCLGHLGRPRSPVHLLKRSFSEGFFFSLGVASRSVYSDIDKTMLVRMSTASAAGVYTAAYRLITMAYVPAQAVLVASTSRLFCEGGKGVSHIARCARGILPVLLAYAGLVGVGLFISAPLVPRLLGPSFGEASRVLRWLAWMPLIQVVHGLLGDVLMGVDRQSVRSASQLAVAGLNIVLNLALIPRMSWRGAVIATYVSEGVLALTMVVLVAHLLLSGRGARETRDSVAAAELSGGASAGLVANPG